METQDLMPNNKALKYCHLSEKPNSPFGAVEYGSDGVAKNSAWTLESVQLGSVSIFRYKGRGLTYSRRRLRHIRSDGVDDFLFGLPLDIPKIFSQSGQSVTAEPGFGIFISSSKPFETFCNGLAGYDYSELLMRVSGPVLRRYVPNIDESCTHPIQMCRGAGGILKSLLDSLLAEGAGLSCNEADQFGLALLEVMTGIFSNEFKYAAPEANSRFVGYAAVRQRATDFIKRNLSNAKLDVSLIARHCNVSPRYLYNAFEASSQTIGTLLREMRLKNCQRDLQNRSLLHLTITQIAFRWGFNSVTSFSRAYHTRFGKAPSEERRAFLHS
jgi:AraC-like DNA-binding protein